MNINYLVVFEKILILSSGNTDYAIEYIKTMNHINIARHTKKHLYMLMLDYYTVKYDIVKKLHVSNQKSNQTAYYWRL